MSSPVSTTLTVRRHARPRFRVLVRDGRGRRVEAFTSLCLALDYAALLRRQGATVWLLRRRRHVRRAAPPPRPVPAGLSVSEVSR